MHEIQDKTIEIVLGSIVAFMGFFSKRAFKAYDDKFEKVESKHEDILIMLNKIDREMVRLNTLMEKEEWKKKR